jgi:hypothetical protein
MGAALVVSRSSEKEGKQMTNLTTEPVSHVTERLTIEIDLSTSEFTASYEAAVPMFPTGQVMEMVARKAPWEEMIEFIA